MANLLLCDGPCQKPLKRHRHDDVTHGSRDTCPRCKLGHEGHVVGLLEPVVFCHGCKTTWDAHVAAERAERVTLITAFETWREERLTALRAQGFAIPDDDLPPDDEPAEAHA